MYGKRPEGVYQQCIACNQDEGGLCWTNSLVTAVFCRPTTIIIYVCIWPVAAVMACRTVSLSSRYPCNLMASFSRTSPSSPATRWTSRRWEGRRDSRKRPLSWSTSSTWKQHHRRGTHVTSSMGRWYTTCYVSICISQILGYRSYWHHCLLGTTRVSPHLAWTS